MDKIDFFSLSPGQWASEGRRNGYKWLASTNYFCSNLFKINDYARSCNEQIEQNARNLQGFWHILKAQLDREPSLSNHNEICVLNTEDVYHSHTQLEMCERVRGYFGYHQSVFRIESNGTVVDVNAIRNKTVVVPFVYLETHALDFLDRFSSFALREGEIKSLIAVCACHVVANNGQYPGDDELPYIDHHSFAIELSFEQVRSMLDLMRGTPPQETFHGQSRPLELQGTTWVSTDGKHRLVFDNERYSANGASYNGDFAIYHYDSSKKAIFLHIDDMYGFAHDITLKVLSVKNGTIEVDGTWGRVTLKKQ